jgi:error-prone DNA polymerase
VSACAASPPSSSPPEQSLRAPPAYAELHCLSNFSFLRGASHPHELVAQAVALGYRALALTDHDTLQGLPEARAEAGRRGIELIAGAEISAEWGGQDDIHILALFVDESNEPGFSELEVFGP